MRGFLLVIGVLLVMGVMLVTGVLLVIGVMLVNDLEGAWRGGESITPAT